MFCFKKGLKAAGIRRMRGKEIDLMVEGVMRW